MTLRKTIFPEWLTVIGCALLSAVLLYFSTGLGEIWPFAWVAPLPLLWLAYGQQRLWHVVAATFLAFALGNIGFVRPFIGMQAATIGIVVAIAGLSAAFVAAVLFGRLVQRRVGWTAALIAFPALWVGIEYLSSLVSPNGTVGSFAYTQAGAPILIQSASLFGIWSITFLLCLFANGCALALRKRQMALPIMAVVVVIFGMNVIYGMVRLSQSPGATARVAVAAKDLPAQRFQSTGEAWLAITTAYANGIHDLVAANPRITTIVLPEKLATLDPQWRNAVIEPLAKAAHDDKVRIIAGFEDDTSPARNIAITFEPDGTSSTYVKRQLLGSEQELTPGSQPGLLTDGTDVAICKDMDFPQMIRSDANHHLGIMFVPAEDFFIDRWMHSRVAVMRGIEGDYSVVRAARKGDIQISDNRGRILANAGSGTDFVARVFDAPIGTGKTVYLIIGDLFAWLCLGAALLMFLFAVYSLRSAKKVSA